MPRLVFQTLKSMMLRRGREVQLEQVLDLTAQEIRLRLGVYYSLDRRERRGERAAGAGVTPRTGEEVTPSVFAIHDFRIDALGVHVDAGGRRADEAGQDVVLSRKCRELCQEKPLEWGWPGYC